MANIENVKDKKDLENKQLILIPKSVLYIYKANKNTSNYMLEQLKLMNNIDAEMNCQRIYLRIMNKQKWIDTKRFDIAMNKIYEIGKIIGGLAKYYAKNN